MFCTIMLLYSFTADRAVHAIALGRPPIQRSYAVAKGNPSTSPGPSLADIQSSLALMQTTLQRIETTQADQGVRLESTDKKIVSIDNKIVSTACSFTLASCFAIVEVTASTAGKHILSTAELITIASQTTGAAVAIFGVIYTILTQIQENQKTP